MTALLRIDGLVKEYPAPGGGFRRGRLRAVDGVDLEVAPGEVVGLVGESGSGKTTVARCALGLTPPTAGSIRFDGVELGERSRTERRALRRELGLVFQNPVAALDPRLPVSAQVSEPLTTHRLARGGALRGRVAELLEDVGLGPAVLDRYPHELSGGQCQRVVIARALATGPRLLILDEPTSSLDVVVQAQILNLLLDLRERHEIAYLVISHDLAVVRHLSERIAVMYLGRIVEQGAAADVFERPRHPYTQALLASVRGGGRETLDDGFVLAGETPRAWAIPAGCRFHPRCPRRAELGAPPECETVDPALVDGAACHFAAPLPRRSGVPTRQVLA